MTTPKKHKQAVRARMDAAGERYTTAARRRRPTGPAAQTLRSFTMGELLHECTTAPRETNPGCGRHCDGECWICTGFAPSLFRSELVGMAVPEGSVMELAGLLSEKGLASTLTVETATPRPGLEGLLIVGTGRGGERFEIVLTQSRVESLCSQPGCERGRGERGAMPWCDGHLLGADAGALQNMAHWWGAIQLDDAERKSAPYGGKGGAALVRAAAVAGCGQRVLETMANDSFPGFTGLEFSDEQAYDEAILAERTRLMAFVPVDDELREGQRQRDLMIVERNIAYGCRCCASPIPSCRQTGPEQSEHCTQACADAAVDPSLWGVHRH